jgi:hypothetical protein
VRISTDLTIINLGVKYSLGTWQSEVWEGGAVAAVARNVVNGSEARLSTLRAVQNDSRPESALLHLRAAKALILAALPLGNHLEPPLRGAGGRGIDVEREQT